MIGPGGGHDLRLLLSFEVTPDVEKYGLVKIHETTFSASGPFEQVTWRTTYIFQLCCRFAPGLSVTEAATLLAVVAGI